MQGMEIDIAKAIDGRYWVVFSKFLASMEAWAKEP
jgi:hypothetical protein